MSLNPADIAAVSRLLDEALDLPTAERESWLAALPPDQQRHAATLREMLARQAHLDTDKPLEAMPRLPADEAVAHAGDLVGPYRLLREIGRGGMGSVWLAERADGSFKRQVALKLPRLAWGAGLAERMAREREIGAMLEHTNIARLYDAGVDGRGRPYLALAYIDGQAIDAWCEAKNLSVRDRLRLFVQVCRAVAYAHGRLVVHRDLKPSNVMVTPDGQAHLLDFGIAKLLHDAVSGETGLTQEKGRVLTPHYASPEQVAGEPITVQSDVYSLGVLLYELLTGTLPITSKRSTLGAAEEAILRGDAPPASSRVKDRATARALRGELDAILAMAMKRDPSQRYATADALAHDIERHLNGETVAARPDSMGYRMRKVLRRHWVGAAATSAVLIALVTGGGVAAVQAQRANDEAARAQHVRRFVLDLFDAAGGSQGKMPAQDLLERGARSIESRFPGQPALQADLFGAVADMFSKIGNAGRSLEYRKHQIETLVAAGAAPAQVADATLILAGTLGGAGRFKDSEVRMRRVLELAGDDPRLRVGAHVGLAYALMMGARKNMPAADQQIAAAEAIMAREAIPAVDRAVALTIRADWLSHAGRMEEAGPLFDEAIQIGLDAEGPHSRRAIDARTSAAWYYMRANQSARSNAYLHAALQTLRAIGGPDDARAAFEEVSLALEAYQRGSTSYTEARAIIERGYAALRPRGWVPAMSFAYLINRIQAFHLTAGDIDNAIRVSADASIDRSVNPMDDFQRWNMLAVSSRLAAITGKPGPAIRDARAALSMDQKSYQGFDLDDSYELVLWALIHDRRYAEARMALTEFEGLPDVLAALTDRAAQPESTELARATLQLERGEVQDLLRATERWQLDTDNRRHEQAWLLRAAAHCAAGSTDQGLDLFARWLPGLVDRSLAVSPQLMHWRAQMGLCALQAGHQQQAREASVLASAALAKQPGVSAHFKAPVLELARRLRGG